MLKYILEIREYDGNITLGIFDTEQDASRRAREIGGLRAYSLLKDGLYFDANHSDTMNITLYVLRAGILRKVGMHNFVELRPPTVEELEVIFDLTAYSTQIYSSEYYGFQG